MFRSLLKFTCALFAVLGIGMASPVVSRAGSITYIVSVRDSTVVTGDNRKTGLTLSFTMVKKLSDGTTVSSPTISEVGNGVYKFSYDPEATGEIVWQIDAGSSLTNPSDRYIDGGSFLDSSRIAAGISSTGTVVVGTNNDKSNYLLASSEHTLISATDVPAGVNAQGYTTTRAAKIDNLDAAVTTRLPTSSYTAPPTVAQIRTELDTNSTKLDAAVSSRMATFTYTAPPTVTAIRQEIDANSVKLVNLDAAVSTRLPTSSYTAAPTAVAVRQEIDANSTKLANLDASVSSRMATFSYSSPPTAIEIVNQLLVTATPSVPVAGSLGEAFSFVAVRLDTAVSGAVTAAQTANSTAIAIKSKTDNLPAQPAARSDVHVNVNIPGP